MLKFPMSMQLTKFLIIFLIFVISYKKWNFLQSYYAHFSI